MRRDYVLRMIEEFGRVLAKILGQKNQRLLREAEGTIEEEVKRLAGHDLATIAALSETELLGSLLQTGDFQAYREKTFMLARLLIEAAELRANEVQGVGAHTPFELRLKALHLLLHTSLREDIHEWPEFVPKIDMLLESLADAPLPIHTHALLMQHYERTGQFAKAEDALFALLDLAPGNAALRELGISFYHRLLTRTGPDLEAGDLPHSEVESGLRELLARARAPAE